MDTATLNHHQSSKPSPIKQDILKIYGKEPETLDQLAQCVVKVIESSIVRKHADLDKGPNVVGFAWEISHRNLVSNSHSSPEGYDQNWGAKPGKPVGYPGWEGRVWIRLKSRPRFRFCFSDHFNNTLTYTSTGGHGSYNGPWSRVATTRFSKYGHGRGGAIAPVECYSWQYKIFDYDWPLVTKDFEMEKACSILRGDVCYNPCHSYSWTDPTTLEQDNQFLSSNML